jgi:hypothetical protein
MTKPTVKIHNTETDEIIEREMTKAEYDQFLLDKAEIESLALAEAEKQAARQSALEKLAALGLTEAEIQALAG